MMPTAATVAKFVGQSSDPAVTGLAGEHLPVIAALVKAYTRGGGFDLAGVPNDDLGAVITTVTARLMSNPDQNASRVGEVSTSAGFVGFSLPELAALNRYRRRAQ